MMMMAEGGRGRGGITSRALHPFTPSQWQELEIQAIIFNCFSLGLPIPSHLLLSIRRNHFSSKCTQPTLGFFPAHSPLGWGCFQLGSRKRAEDPEPGRCRRTDGKKWRCSREAFPDSKYCERHLHRGKNRIKGPPLEFSLHIKGAALKESRNFHGVEELGVEATSSSGASGLSFQQQNTSFQSPLAREKKLQQHCFVMGADLKLEMPVEFENGGGKKPNHLHSFFPEREKKSDEIWKDERSQSSSRQPMPLPSLLDLNF